MSPCILSPQLHPAFRASVSWLRSLHPHPSSASVAPLLVSGCPVLVLLPSRDHTIFITTYPCTKWCPIHPNHHNPWIVLANNIMYIVINRSINIVLNQTRKGIIIMFLICVVEVMLCILLWVAPMIKSYFARV